MGIFDIEHKTYFTQDMRQRNSNLNQESFADAVIEMRTRKSQNRFLIQVDQLIDWDDLRKVIEKKYKKRENAVGGKAYDCILLFKIMLLQTWYNLSDPAVEERINDSIAFSRFLGLSMEETSPDHSTISRFRTELTRLGLIEKVFEAVNKQLAKHRVSIKSGVIVDASVIDTPNKPKGPKNIEVAGDREDTRSEEAKAKEEEYRRTIEKKSPGADGEAAWVIKQKELRYGYKVHTATDTKGIVLSVITTPANESDVVHLEDVIERAKVPEGTQVYADKGYASAKNRAYLKEKGYKDGIMHKGSRGHAITEEQRMTNKLLSKTRSTIERTFGGIRRWFGGGRCRYRGLQKAHTQNLLEAMAFNLYRMPSLILFGR